MRQMTISEQVWLYVKNKPYLQEILAKKIVNYSALARQINREMKVSEEAIKASLIRITRKLRKQKAGTEQKILSLLRNSTLEAKTKTAIVVAKKKLDLPVIASFRGPSAWSYIVEEKDLKKISRKDVYEITKNMDILLIISPKEIDKTSGVMAYVLGILANENVNLLHVISCYRDTLLMVHEVDTAKAFSILKEIIK